MLVAGRSEGSDRGCAGQQRGPEAGEQHREGRERRGERGERGERSERADLQRPVPSARPAVGHPQLLQAAPR